MGYDAGVELGHHRSTTRPLVDALDAFGDAGVLYHPPASVLAARHLTEADQDQLLDVLITVANRAHRWLSVLGVQELDFTGGEEDVFVNTAVAILDVGPGFRLDRLGMSIDQYTVAVIGSVVPDILAEHGTEGLRRLTYHVFTSTYQLAGAISGKL